MKCPKCHKENTGFAVIVGRWSGEYHECSCGYHVQRQGLIENQQSEIESLRAELSTLKEENSRLRSGLEKLEWSDAGALKEAEGCE